MVPLHIGTIYRYLTARLCQIEPESNVRGFRVHAGATQVATQGYAPLKVVIAQKASPPSARTLASASPNPAVRPMRRRTPFSVFLVGLRHAQTLLISSCTGKAAWSGFFFLWVREMSGDACTNLECGVPRRFGDQAPIRSRVLTLLVPAGPWFDHSK